jgi:hypothetical protein
MDFGEVLSRSWKIIWKHKVLWIFGILSGCAGGSGNANFNYRQPASPETQRWFEQTFGQFTESQWITLAVIFVIAILLLVIIALFLGTVGRIGLVRGASQADQNIESSLRFGELFKGSLPYFWRVFLLDLLFGLAILVLIMALLAIGIAAAALTFGLGLFCIIPVICLLIPIFIFIGMVLQQARIAIVTENLGIIAGWRRGWQVVTSQFGTIVLMWLILDVGIGFIGSMILAAPIIVIAFTAMAPYFFEQGAGSNIGLLAFLICFVAYLPVLIVASGIMQSYIQAGWTLTFRRLTGRLAETLPSVSELPAQNEPLIEPPV